MSLPRSVAEVLKSHVTLEVEGIDRVVGQLEVEVACDRIRGIFRLKAIP